MTGQIRHYAKDEAGFSFAELMVVIALIGILSAIALPSLLGNLPEKRLKNAARNLYSDMQRARLQAVKLNKTVAVTFNDEQKIYDLKYIDNEGVSMTIKTGSLAEYGDVRFGCAGMTDWNSNAADAPTGSLSFTKTGTANPPPFIIFLSSSNVNACYAVDVTEFGAVKIRWQHNGGSWN